MVLSLLAAWDYFIGHPLWFAVPIVLLLLAVTGVILRTVRHRQKRSALSSQAGRDPAFRTLQKIVFTDSEDVLHIP